MSRLIIAALFFLFAFALIFSAHYFVYRSTLFFFKPLPAFRSVLATVFAVAGLSFTLSMIMVHNWETKLVRGYYYLSGAGLGLVLYLIIGFAAAWLIYFALSRFAIVPPLELLGFLAVSLALITAAFGLWNAFSPKVVRITMPVENLPTFWQDKTVVQLSDVHLGAIYGVGYAKKLVEQVNALEPELILLTGDLFDGMDGRLDELAGSLSGLKSKRGTFFITGNHETYLGVEQTLRAIKNGPIEHLGGKVASVDGLAIVGIDYPVRGRQESVVGQLKSLEFSRPAILLYHEPRQVPEIAASKRFDLMLSGHTHRGQLWPFEFIVKAIYGPYAYGLNRIGDFHSYTSVGTGTWGPPLRTEGRSEITVITLVDSETNN